ncbi:signal peptide peptidase SppA [Nocardioides dongxiaopingii]|uniref:signal peptide peptidase SppA n=1 Tax=Nocardioides sp. S-1144 TaxID=2582905 RepID=UPI00110D6AFB|nr:signal peptide peptidase SppA [Nocardioides sp. S-1144]QCW50619.1 signal peptide peptidase SppA [Nocardioides sp. S-1144]
MKLRALPLIDRLPGLGGDRPRTVLELDLSHGVQVGPPGSPLEALRLRQAPTLRALGEGLRRAAGDDDVLGLLVHVGTCPLTLAQADEVGALVADFSQDKPSVAWTETFGELGSGLAGYRVAVHAREIWLQPSGAVGLVGVSAGITLLRGGLEKLGVDPEFGQRHEYKSAAEQLAGREVSEANREMTQRLADAVVDDTVTRVAARRSLTEDQVRAAMAVAPLSAAAALDAGLVDRLGYADEVRAWARETWTPAWEPRYVHRYAGDGPGGAGQALRAVTRRHQPRVAVVDVTGPIVLGPGTARQAGAERVGARLREVGRDDDVRAVVLRVDSPGGSYVASDAIRREVLRLRESGRPVVAAMGTVAASGGYFVAMGADEVVAQPTTLTGSIGVLAGKMVVERLLDRAGIVHESVSAGPRAAMMTASRPFTDEERAVLDTWLDDVYADFTAKAAADRGLALDVLEPLARGRVWTGGDAAERGLVDHLGGTRLALERVCALVGLDVDDVALRTPSPLEFLRQLRVAESSESPAAASLTTAATVGPGGPEAVLARLSEAVGLPLTHGVLSMPPGLRLLG